MQASSLSMWSPQMQAYKKTYNTAEIYVAGFFPDEYF